MFVFLLFLGSESLKNAIKIFTRNFCSVGVTWPLNQHLQLCRSCFSYEKNASAKFILIIALYQWKKKKKKWSKDFIDFDFAVRNFKENNHCFADFDKISSEKKNIVYKITAKDY